MIPTKSQNKSLDDDSYDPADSSYYQTEPTINTLETNIPLNEAFQRLTLPRNSHTNSLNNSVNEYAITPTDTNDYGDDDINILNTTYNDVVC